MVDLMETRALGNATPLHRLADRERTSRRWDAKQQMRELSNNQLHKVSMHAEVLF